MSEQVTITEQVRVVNKGDKHVTFNWNNRSFVIPGNGETFIPFECVKLYCGDPRAGAVVQRIQDQYGQDMVIPDRHAEVIRLRQYWQSTVIKFREYLPGDRSWFEEDGCISDRAPVVEVYALTGDRIFTVLDDPFGDRVIAADSPTIAEKSRMEQVMLDQSRTITDQDKMIKLLMKRLDINPNDLGPDLPLGNDPMSHVLEKQDSVMEAPTVATVTEKPKMVYNPRTRRISPARTPVADPTTIEALPEEHD